MSSNSVTKTDIWPKYFDFDIRLSSPSMRDEMS